MLMLFILFHSFDRARRLYVFLAELIQLLLILTFNIILGVIIENNNANTRSAFTGPNCGLPFIKVG